jgi:hypothetical protein
MSVLPRDFYNIDTRDVDLSKTKSFIIISLRVEFVFQLPFWRLQNALQVLHSSKK